MLEISKIYPFLNDKKDLRIELERFEQNSLRIKWKQLGEFTYPISRYFILVSVNGKNQSYSIDNQFINSSLQIEEFILKY